MHLIVFITLAISLLSSVSHATVATYEQHLAKGVAGVEEADYRVAVEEFRAALKEKPLDPAATLYLGIALNRSGDREAETVLKQALAMEPADPRTNIELGIYYFTYSLYGEARDYFENTIKLAPGTEFSAKAREYLTRISEGGLAKPWALNLSNVLRIFDGISGQFLGQYQFIVSLSVHVLAANARYSVTFISPGQAKRAQSGLRGRMVTLPVTSGVPCASASAT